MKVLRQIGQLCVCPPDGGQADIGAVKDAALVWDGGLIRWAGRESELPQAYRGAEFLDAGGGLVIPGLIDCHTHLAFGGWRADEFEWRIQGRSYLDIARAGGGIASTVRQTRAANADELTRKAAAALDAMARLGVTTVEAKSGYGLDRDNEIKLLEVYAALAERQPVSVVPTFLGAHIVPPEYRDNRSGYLALLLKLIPEIADRGLARFCDVFVEDTAFSSAEARQILACAAEHGLRAKVHADQLSDSGGAALAAAMNAVSAEHLEYASDEGVACMAEAGVVAVSLPIANLYLGQADFRARRFLDAGVPVAVATDFNPGSAPSWHLPLALTLACVVQRMTPAEALKGGTIIAARALALDDRGSLAPGRRADFALIDAPDVNHWLYHFRANACLATVIGGELCHGRLPAA